MACCNHAGSLICFAHSYYGDALPVFSFLWCRRKNRILLVSGDLNYPNYLVLLLLIADDFLLLQLLL